MSGEKWNALRLSTGDRSILRRNAGKMFGEDMRAMEAFYRAVGPERLSNESVCFAALCMECLWRQEDRPRRRPFEEMLRERYQNSKTTDSMKRRMMAFLDTPWSQDGFLLGKICSIVRMLRAEDARTMPDFERLADDLTNWNLPDRQVQQRWVHTICQSADDRKESGTETNEIEMNETEEE